MEPQPENPEPKTGPKIPTVEISVELLQNIRNIIEVANARIQWKTSELLPVGRVITQMDEHLKPFLKKSDSD
jgi:hypothetical protein